MQLLKKLDILGSGWIFIPAVFFFAAVFYNVQNIPIMDDYDAILVWINAFRHANAWDGFLLLFKQHNEHRILASRLIYLFDYWMTGGVNFRTLTIIGDMQLVVLAFSGIYLIRQVIFKRWAVIAIFWCMAVFDLNTYEAGSWAMASIQDYGIIMLFFLGLVLYRRNHLVAGSICQILCIFSSGNGIIAALFLFASTWNPLHQKAFYVSLFSLFPIPLYFLDYNHIPHAIDLGKSAVFFIQMAGAPFSFNLSFPCGLVVLVAFVILFPYNTVREWKTLWPLLCGAGFILASMGVIAIVRGPDPTVQFQTSRYLIYPQLLIAIDVLLMYVALRGKMWPVAAILPMLILIWMANYGFGRRGFVRTAEHQQEVLYWYPDQIRAKEINDQACGEDIYCIEAER